MDGLVRWLNAGRMDLLTGASDAALVSLLLTYYRRTAAFIDASLAGTRLVLRHFPRGLDQPGFFEITPFGVTYAVEFHTWHRCRPMRIGCSSRAF